MSPPEDDEGDAEQWYIAVSERVYGPADRGTLDEWARQGRIRADALGCRVGSDEWLALSRIPQLSDLGLLEPPSPDAPPADDQLPPSPLAEPGPKPPRPHQICPCPECTGPVNLIASASGGSWREFWTPTDVRFICGACGGQLSLDQLPANAQASVRRQMLIDLTLSVIVPLVLLALCLVPIAALVLSLLP